jgi:hypothetical protein
VAVIATLAVLVVAAVLSARGGGGGDEGASAPTAPSTPTSQAPATTAESRTSPPAAATAATAEESPSPGTATGPTGEAAPVLAAGRHPVFFTDFDVAGSTVEFDLVQYLTGDEARAYAEEHEDQWGDDYYDQYVVNENPRLRTLPVAGDVQITVLQTADSTISPHPITFRELPGYVGPDQGFATPHLGSSVFWLTVRDATVVAIQEQYTP